MTSKQEGKRGRKVVIKLTINEAHALDSVVGNGWGDGDFAGYGGQHIPTQRRAINKLARAIKDYYTR